MQTQQFKYFFVITTFLEDIGCFRGWRQCAGFTESEEPFLYLEDLLMGHLLNIAKEERRPKSTDVLIVFEGQSIFLTKDEALEWAKNLSKSS